MCWVWHPSAWLVSVVHTEVINVYPEAVLCRALSSSLRSGDGGAWCCRLGTEGAHQSALHVPNALVLFFLLARTSHSCQASSLAEAENKPSPAVLVGLKTVSNMLMGKDSKGEGRKAKNKRAREANGGEEQVDMTEVEEVGKQKRPKASKSKDTADSKKKGSSPSPKTRKRKSQE